METERKDLFGVCPYATSQRVLAGKWSIFLLHLLEDGPVRFNELQRRMPENMTHTTLSRQLKQLEEDGLIQRIVYSEIPPKVEYQLSPIGRKFGGVLDSLRDWGMDYIDYLHGAEPNPARE